ncbi:MAG: type II secretion system protein M [Clostridiales bacterium]|jgi:hypothetical protein|nr:type II secretion system protein M [Clostridiales bacterium]
MLTTISKRDIVIIVALLSFLLGYVYYQYLLVPTNERIENKRAEATQLEQDLMQKEALRNSLEELNNTNEKIMADIEKVASVYLPDLTIQYYYDLLNEKAYEAGVSPVSIGTSPLTSADASVVSTGEGGERVNTLTSAIDEYTSAIASEAPPADAPDAARGRYSFKYIPITYSITDGDFTAVQNFVQSLNDLNYTMAINSADFSVNNKAGIDANFSISFISVDRLTGSDGLDNYTYEAIGPAGVEDIFLYSMPEEEEAEQGTEVPPTQP